jgi:uncharacterized protein (TIGR04255 family)
MTQIEKIFNFKHIPRRSFKNHFLNQVHCEIRFDGNYTATVVQSVDQLKDIFKSMGYESHQPVMQGQFAFKIGESGNTPLMENNSSVIGYKFSSQSPQKDVQILGDKIIFSDFSYVGFEDFLKIFHAVTIEVAKLIPFQNVNKVGLRKINSIKIAPVVSFQDACVIFNPSIFNSIRSSLIDNESLTFNEEKIVLERDSKFCLLQFRMRKLGEPDAFEATLDFDVVLKQTLDIETVFIGSLPALNDEHFDLFMWAVTDDLINLMEA